LYKQYKRWLIFSLVILLTSLSILSTFNYLMDPLWSFNNFLFTKYKHSYNERTLKTNLLVFSDVKYDGILIGSSRSTFINTNRDKEKHKVFNYSAASLQIKEYEGLINNVKKITHNDLNIIIIGLDFFTYLNESPLDYSPTKYYDDTQSIFYRFKILLSYDTFKKAMKNLKIDNNFVDERVYDKNYNLFVSKKEMEINHKNIINSAKKFKKQFYNSRKPIDNFKQYINSMLNNNPKTKFIVFTTPVSKELLEVITKDKSLYLLYERWIDALVSSFGEVNHFMYLNTIAKDSSNNFYDSHHMYPHTADKVYTDLNTGRETDNMMKINKNNLNQKIKYLRKINLINNNIKDL